MLGAQDFPGLIQEFHAELKQHGERWRTRALELALRRMTFHSPYEFLDWAKRDRHWSFTLAEVLRESSANPTELAARLLVAMARQVEEEREIREAELAAETLSSQTVYAD
jgi:hypothetical protein